MLKKNDLAKQFELLTKQEIKNYQDSLNNVLQSIHDLNEKIIQTNDRFSEMNAIYHSNNTNLRVENQKLSNECKNLKEILGIFQRDQLVLNKENIYLLNTLTSALSLKNEMDSLNQTKFDQLSEFLRKLRIDFDDSKRIYQDNLDDLLRRFRTEIQMAKEEIMNAPTDASIVRKDLEEKIAMHKVDVNGIMREIKILKADNTITEKKIEQIYTLISRLQKSQESAT